MKQHISLCGIDSCGDGTFCDCPCHDDRLISYILKCDCPCHDLKQDDENAYIQLNLENCYCCRDNNE
jgi:hypothetical protein